MAEDKKKDDTHAEDKKVCTCAKKADAKAHKEDQKKIKNLVSIAILLGGIALGSLFFDITQLVRGEGFSQKAVREAKVVEHASKTWVSYDDPKVIVDVFSSEDCVDCVTDEVLVWLRRIVPTIVARENDIRDEDTKEHAKDLGVAYIPSFVFSKEIEQTDFFQQAGILFEQKNDRYVLKGAQLGIPVGEYIAAPTAQGAITLGADTQETSVTLVEFSDFTCPFCKTSHNVVEQVLNEFDGKVRYVYKHFLSPEQPRALPAAHASECAQAQEKFIDYANILFTRQDQWSKSETDTIFITYARELGLDTEVFGQCLGDVSVRDHIVASQSEAEAFGLLGSPTFFVNDTFAGNGVVTYEDLKKLIEEAAGDEGEEESAQE